MTVQKNIHSHLVPLKFPSAIILTVYHVVNNCTIEADVICVIIDQSLIKGYCRLIIRNSIKNLHNVIH